VSRPVGIDGSGEPGCREEYMSITEDTEDTEDTDERRLGPVGRTPESGRKSSRAGSVV
jgi:hypothetical protein